jgi:hypothetical protein
MVMVIEVWWMEETAKLVLEEDTQSATQCNGARKVRQ